jgi:hypothetical protein
MRVVIKVDWGVAIIEVFFLIGLRSFQLYQSSMFYRKGT